jgi:hypothetical protein
MFPTSTWRPQRQHNYFYKHNCVVFAATNQHGGRKDNTIILTNGQLAISTTTGEAHV